MKQPRINFWLRVTDRSKWAELQTKGISTCEILSRGINLVYEEEKNEQQSERPNVDDARL